MTTDSVSKKILIKESVFRCTQRDVNYVQSDILKNAINIIIDGYLYSYYQFSQRFLKCIVMVIIEVVEYFGSNKQFLNNMVQE
jgi:hypothetical protein